MQSTFRPTRAHVGFSQLQLITLAVAIGLLALSIVGFVARHDVAPARSQQHPVAATSAGATFRFLEANLLPDAAPRPVNNTHLLEINMLPGDPALATPMSLSRARFLEFNQLPGVAAPAHAPSGVVVNRQ
jgi:hypothetical protein